MQRLCLGHSVGAPRPQPHLDGISRRCSGLPPRRAVLRLVRVSAEAPGDAASEALSEETVAGMVERLLATDPEAAARVQRVNAAAQRVAELQAESARLGAAMAEAAAAEAAGASASEAATVLASSSRVAELEALAAEKMMQAAELQAEDAASARRQAEAVLQEDAERLESGKAAAVAGAGGALGTLPLILASGASPLQGLLVLGAAAASSVLFGVTFRYAVRKDALNVQLKGGVVAAFGLVRGLAQATEIVAGSSGGSVDLTLDALLRGALAAGESMLTFAFAAAALEAAFQQGYVKRFGDAGSGGSDAAGDKQ